MKICAPLLLLSVAALGCAPQEPPKPPKSQLEIREFQTREYETRDTKMVMKAVLNTLQDDGYIVHNAVPDLGLITATKDVEVEHPGGAADSPLAMGLGIGLGVLSTGRHSGFGWGMGSGDDGRSLPRSSSIEVSVNVSEFGPTVRVRANFQKRTTDGRGAVYEAHQIEEPKFYQDFFSKVDKGIFIQREKL